MKELRAVFPDALETKKKKKQKQKKTIHNNYLLQQFYSVQTPSYIQLINSAVLSSLQNRLPEIFCKK